MNPPNKVRKAADEALLSSPKIHYEAADGKRLMCGQSDIYIVEDGERMRIWYRTKRPVTCKSCVKFMEQRVREEIKGLTAENYEDLLAHIETFKQKYTGSQKDPVPPSVNGLS